MVGSGTRRSLAKAVAIQGVAMRIGILGTNWGLMHVGASRGGVTVTNSFAAAEGRAKEGPMLGASGDFGGISHVLDAAL